MERTYKRTQFTNPSMLRGSDEEIWFRSRSMRGMRRRWAPGLTRVVRSPSLLACLICMLELRG